MQLFSRFYSLSDHPIAPTRTPVFTGRGLILLLSFTYERHIHALHLVDRLLRYKNSVLYFIGFEANFRYWPGRSKRDLFSTTACTSKEPVCGSISRLAKSSLPGFRKNRTIIQYKLHIEVL
jgi:hypothetical protein